MLKFKNKNNEIDFQEFTTHYKLQKIQLGFRFIRNYIRVQIDCFLTVGFNL